MKRYGTVQKSLRLSSDLAEWIDTHPGESFTDRLEAVLRKSWKGEKRLNEKLAYLEEEISRKQEELRHFRELQDTLRTVLRRVTALSRELAEIEAELSPYQRKSG